MLRHLAVGMLAASLALPSPAAAQSVDQDMRCMILSNAFKVAAKEAAPRQAASAAYLYYLGRVAARVPAGELKNRFRAQAIGLKGQNGGLLMNACFQQLQAQERAMIALSQEVTPRSTPAAVKK